MGNMVIYQKTGSNLASLCGNLAKYKYEYIYFLSIYIPFFNNIELPPGQQIKEGDKIHSSLYSRHTSPSKLARPLGSGWLSRRHINKCL